MPGKDHKAADGTAAQNRYRYWLVLAAILFAIILAAVLLWGKHRIQDPSNVLTTLAWITLIIIAFFFFEAPLTSVLVNLAKKIESAQNIKTKWLEITGTERLPAPKDNQDVSLGHLALLHTSFVRPDRTQDFNDGSTYYQIEVVLVAPAPVLNRVRKVIYHLDEAYPEDQRTTETTDRKSRFKLKQLANGTSIVVAEVELHGQTEPLRLNRFIDLRPDGPRI